MSDTNESPAADPAPETVAASPADRIDAVFRDWLHAAVHDSPVSRDTDAYNHLITHALPDLKQRLLSE